MSSIEPKLLRTTELEELCNTVIDCSPLCMVPERITREMKKDPSTYDGCRTLKDYHGRAFERGVRRSIYVAANILGLNIRPYPSDPQPYFREANPEDFGEHTGVAKVSSSGVFLSGQRFGTTRTEYDSVILFPDNTITVFEATVSDRQALERMDPVKYDQHLSHLRRRLTRRGLTGKMGYVVVTIADFIGPEQNKMMDAMDKFENDGGILVDIPISFRTFCDEVDRCVKREGDGLPLGDYHKILHGDASWDHLTVRTKRKSARPRGLKPDRERAEYQERFLSRRPARMEES
jgi:hypothetical protein